MSRKLVVNLEHSGDSGDSKLTTTISRTLTATAIALTFMLAGGFAMPLLAASAQPYNGGYISVTAEGHNSFQMKTTTLNAASSRSSFLASLISAAGFVTQSSADPTGWMYQIAADLKTDDNIRLGINVWFLNQCRQCPSSPPIIGHNGTAPNDVKYAYINMIWSGNTLGFYGQRQENDGDFVSTPVVTYDPVTMGPNDPSRTFKMGTKSKTVTIPCSTTPTFKFFQFGMESGSVVTQSWKIKQYDIWADGASLATKTAKTTTGGGGSCPSSTYAWATYYTNATGTYGVQVGGNAYTNVNAKYNKNDATVPDGQAHWYKDGSSTTITKGLTMWP